MNVNEISGLCIKRQQFIASDGHAIPLRIAMVSAGIFRISLRSIETIGTIYYVVKSE